VITVELKVNGAMISHTWITNTGGIRGEKDIYEYVHTGPQTGKLMTLKGEVEHLRRDGAEKLVEIVMAKVAL